jgi:hypothetical protein
MTGTHGRDRPVLADGSVLRGDPSVLILEKAEARSTSLNEAGEA